MGLAARPPPPGRTAALNGGSPVLGPLPSLHRLLVVGVVLVVGICSGAWIALFTPLQVAAPAGALLGAVAGVAAGFALVHDFSQPRSRTGRVRRHH